MDNKTELSVIHECLLLATNLYTIINIIVISRKTIEIAQPIYDTIDIAFLSFLLMFYIKFKRLTHFY